MRIALVAEWVDPWRGGAETSTLQFMHQLIAQGVELHVFTRSRPSPAPGFTVHTISGAALSRTRQSMTFAHRVTAQLAHHQFDIVHAISPCRGADVYQPRGGTVAESVARNLALRSSLPARALKRAANRLNLKQRYLLSLERDLFCDPAGPVVAALSDYVVRQLQEHYALPPERIYKVFNGVDLPNVAPAQRQQNRREIRADFGISEDTLLVLLVAHNFRLKGVGCWMEAQAKLLRQGVDSIHALVVGKGDSARWHRLAGRLGLAGHLTFVGPSERVPAFRHAADVLVHPTFYDPCSRVVLEALATGLPTVTTRWDGSAEMIEDGVNGFVLDDPNDPAKLVELVQRLRAVELRETIGTEARRRADAFSMQRHARGMLELYQTVSERRPKR